MASLDPAKVKVKININTECPNADGEKMLICMFIFIATVLWTEPTSILCVYFSVVG